MSFESMTADQIASYNGPVFHATVWWRDEDGQTARSDIEAPTHEDLLGKLALANMTRHVVDWKFGPIVRDDCLIETNPATGEPLGAHQ